jgi:C4-dicarboxylate-specific signal transduction histidine kinase
MLTGALDDIVEQARRASAIVKRVRTLLNPQRADYEIFRISEVMTHAASLLKPELDRHGMVLQLALVDDGAQVRGDKVLLEQVLVNLIHNAMQAMQELPRHRRTIILSSQRSAHSVRIAVSDHGPGIPADQREQVFAPFFTTKPDGLGLGLNICRTIIEAHGGAIAVDNRDGGGATFSFTLPTAP